MSLHKAGYTYYKINMTDSFLFQDVVSYCISVGLVDKISWYFSHVQGPLDNEAGVIEVILAAMRLVSALAETLRMR